MSTNSFNTTKYCIIVIIITEKQARQKIHAVQRQRPLENRKHRQSYRHADPRRQRPQVAQVYGVTDMVTSNRVTVTTFVTV